MIIQDYVKSVYVNKFTLLGYLITIGLSPKVTNSVQNVWKSMQNFTEIPALDFLTGFTYTLGLSLLFGSSFGLETMESYKWARNKIKNGNKVSKENLFYCNLKG